MSIGYKIKKKIVRYRQKIRKRGQDLAFKHMTIEDFKVFNLAKDIATKYYTNIRYDKVSGDTIIKVDDIKICVVLNHDTIGVYTGTDGFFKISIPPDAFEYLMRYVDIQAHKDRRKILKDVKLELASFVDKINDRIK